MDAVKFIYEARRRYNATGQVCSVLSGWVEPEIIVKELEEWCKEHPVKTRQSVFLEQWPNVHLEDDGVLGYCPKIFGINTSCLSQDGRLKKCSDCRREFWSQEVE